MIILGSINNTKNSENDVYEAEEDYSGVNQVYDVNNNNNPLFDAEYDERLDENQEFIAAEVNPDRERTLNKLLHQEQVFQ